MKMRRLFSTIALIVMLAVSVSAQNPSVTVTGGSGSGTFAPGETVHVWADVHVPGRVFDRWTGDADVLADPLAAHAALVMPARGVNLTAVFKPGDTKWVPREEIVNGSRVFSHFPPGHRGVVTFYHGSGGSAAGWMDGRTNAEGRLFCNAAVAAGYAVLAAESQDRVAKQWNPRGENNPDVENVASILDAFRKRGDIGESEPIFGVGMSNGGGFVPLVSMTLKFKATAIFCAKGYDYVIERTMIPTVWCVSRNDGTVGTTGPRENFDMLRGRGVPAEFYVLEPSPVYPLRFARIDGATEDDSRGIYAALKNNGFLDAKDFLIQNPRQSGWEILFPPRQQGPIDDQLSVCHAEHKFYSDFAHKVLAFFGAADPADSVKPTVANVVASKNKVIRKKDATLAVTWTSTDNRGVVSHDVLFAGDGTNFSTTVVTGLPGAAQSFTWTIPDSVAKTKSGRLKVLARDAAGNVGEGATSGVFIVK